MTYWNRKRLLANTLKSIAMYDHPIKVIVVDDCSTDGDDIHEFETDNIRIMTMQNKTWLNTCMAFNYAFKEVDTDVVIFQNAECIHIGDVVGHTMLNIKDNVYLNYSCYSINEGMTNRVLAGENITTVINPLNSFECNWGESGWYNHPVFRPKMFHFCSAIMTKDLYALGGFDERFAAGLGYDDDDLVNRIQMKGMEIKMIEDPFVVHQHHKAYFQQGVRKMRQYMRVNWNIEKENQANRIIDVKPFNKVYK